MKIVKYGLLSIYILFVLFITMLLFTFNKFSNSVIFDTTIIGNTTNIGKYNRGDLLIVSKKTPININDKILFYDTKSGKNFLNYTSVLDIIKTNDTETTYVIRDNVFLSSEYVIGNFNDIKSVPFLGYLYMLFTSKIGYLLFIIIPVIISFIFELRKYGRHDKKKS